MSQVFGQWTNQEARKVSPLTSQNQTLPVWLAAFTLQSPKTFHLKPVLFCLPLFTLCLHCLSVNWLTVSLHPKCKADRWPSQERTWQRAPASAGRCTRWRRTMAASRTRQWALWVVAAKRDAPALVQRWSLSWGYQEKAVAHHNSAKLVGTRFFFSLSNYHLNVHNTYVLQFNHLKILLKLPHQRYSVEWRKWSIIFFLGIFTKLFFFLKQRSFSGCTDAFLFCLLEPA